MRLEYAYRGGLVLVHEPAVAGDIGGKNGGEPTVEEALLGHVFSALAGARQSSVLHTAVRIARTVLLRGLRPREGQHVVAVPPGASAAERDRQHSGRPLSDRIL